MPRMKHRTSLRTWISACECRVSCPFAGYSGWVHGTPGPDRWSSVMDGGLSLLGDIRVLGSQAASVYDVEVGQRYDVQNG